MHILFKYTLIYCNIIYTINYAFMFICLCTWVQGVVDSHQIIPSLTKNSIFCYLPTVYYVISKL